MQNSGKKTEQKTSIVFFGTGPVAAASLELLAESFVIEAVVTKPRPEHHRGDTPVLDVAAQCGYKVIEVVSKEAVSAKITGERFLSKVAVLIDFGIIVNQDVIDVFPLGIVNSHFSLLPEWRGADPITFAILSGQERTGVSLMLLVEAMDEGPVIGFGVQELDMTFTTPLLTERLVQLSYSLLRDLLPNYINKAEKTGISQAELPQLITDFDYPSTPSYSRKLSKADSVLDFNKPAIVLEREIRAFIEWPKSKVAIAGIPCVITAAHVIPDQTTKPIGMVFIEGKTLCIQTAEGILAIDMLKPAGKKEMSGTAFLAGYGKKL